AKAGDRVCDDVAARPRPRQGGLDPAWAHAPRPSPVQGFLGGVGMAERPVGGGRIMDRDRRTVIGKTKREAAPNAQARPGDQGTPAGHSEVFRHTSTPAKLIKFRFPASDDTVKVSAIAQP